MYRGFINQPSTLQPFHYMHGVKVLVDINTKNNNVIVYFIEGTVISAVVPASFVSKGGW